MTSTEQPIIIPVKDWDDLVVKVYGKPYNFQQQSGCRDKGLFDLQVPTPASTIRLNKTPEMGVEFDTWVNRQVGVLCLREHLFWDRDFYPDIRELGNDLHKKGLLAKGQYVIDIYW